MNKFTLDEMFFSADLLIKEGKIGQAMEVLTEIIEEQPDYGMAHNHLGWVYETKYKDYPRAEKHYKAAIAYAPNYTASYLNYAVLLSTLERFDDLAALLEKAKTVEGISKATIYNEFGIMYELKGAFDLAIEHYKKAALSVLNEKDLELYQGSINRCTQKKNLFDGGGGNYGGGGQWSKG